MANADTTRQRSRRRRLAGATLALLLLLGLALGLWPGYRLWLPPLLEWQARARLGLELRVESLRLERQGLRAEGLRLGLPEAEAPALALEALELTAPGWKALAGGRVTSLTLRGLTLRETGLRALRAELAGEQAPDAAPDLRLSRLRALIESSLPRGLAVEGGRFVAASGRDWPLESLRLWQRGQAEGLVLGLELRSGDLGDPFGIGAPGPLRLRSRVRLAGERLEWLELGSRYADVWDFALERDPATGRLETRRGDWDREKLERLLGLALPGEPSLGLEGLSLLIATSDEAPGWAAALGEGAAYARLDWTRLDVAWEAPGATRRLDLSTAGRLGLLWQPERGLLLLNARLDGSRLTWAQAGGRVDSAPWHWEGGLVWNGSRLRWKSEARLPRLEPGQAWSDLPAAGLLIDAGGGLEPVSGAMEGRVAGAMLLEQRARSTSWTLPLEVTLALRPGAEGRRLEGTARLSPAPGTLALRAAMPLGGAAAGDWRLDLRGIELAPLLDELRGLGLTALDGLRGRLDGALAYRLGTGGDETASGTLRAVGVQGPGGMPRRPLDLNLTGRGEGSRVSTILPARLDLSLEVPDLLGLKLHYPDADAANGAGLAFRSAGRVERVEELLALFLPAESLPPLAGALAHRARWRWRGDALRLEQQGDWGLKGFRYGTLIEDLAGTLPLRLDFEWPAAGSLPRGAPQAIDISLSTASLEAWRLRAGGLEWAFPEARLAGAGRLGPDGAFALRRAALDLGGVLGLEASGRVGQQIELDWTLTSPDLAGLAGQLGYFDGNPAGRLRLGPGILRREGTSLTLAAPLELETPGGSAPGGLGAWGAGRLRAGLEWTQGTERNRYRLSDGALRLSSATVAGLALSDIDCALGFADRRLTLDLRRIVLYSGRAAGRVLLDLADGADLTALPLEARARLEDIDLGAFTRDYPTGDVALLGRADLEASARLRGRQIQSFAATLSAASDLVHIDKASIRQILTQGRSSGMGLFGFLTPEATLDRHYREDDEDAVRHLGKLMVPFRDFRIDSTYRDGIFINDILMDNPHFKIQFTPRVPRSAAAEFLRLSQQTR